MSHRLSQGTTEDDGSVGMIRTRSAPCFPSFRHTFTQLILNTIQQHSAPRGEGGTTDQDVHNESSHEKPEDESGSNLGTLNPTANTRRRPIGSQQRPTTQLSSNSSPGQSVGVSMLHDAMLHNSSAASVTGHLPAATFSPNHTLPTVKLGGSSSSVFDASELFELCVTSDHIQEANFLVDSLLDGVRNRLMETDITTTDLNNNNSSSSRPTRAHSHAILIEAIAFEWLDYCFLLSNASFCPVLPLQRVCARGVQKIMAEIRNAYASRPTSRYVQSLCILFGGFCGLVPFHDDHESPTDEKSTTVRCDNTNDADESFFTPRVASNLPLLGKRWRAAAESEQKASHCGPPPPTQVTQQQQRQQSHNVSSLVSSPFSKMKNTAGGSEGGRSSSNPSGGGVELNPNNDNPTTSTVSFQRTLSNEDALKMEVYFLFGGEVPQYINLFFPYPELCRGHATTMNTLFQLPIFQRHVSAEQFSQELTSAEKPLGLEEVLMIALMTAARQQCAYTTRFFMTKLVEYHLFLTPLAEGISGVAEDPLDSFWERLRQALAAPSLRLRSLQPLIAKLTCEPWMIEADDSIQKLLSQSNFGWTIAEVTHAVLVVCHVISLSGLVSTAGMEPDGWISTSLVQGLLSKQAAGPTSLLSSFCDDEGRADGITQHPEASSLGGGEEGRRVVINSRVSPTTDAPVEGAAPSTNFAAANEEEGTLPTSSNNNNAPPRPTMDFAASQVVRIPEGLTKEDVALQLACKKAMLKMQDAAGSNATSQWTRNCPTRSSVDFARYYGADNMQFNPLLDNRKRDPTTAKRESIAGGNKRPSQNAVLLQLNSFAWANGGRSFLSKSVDDVPDLFRQEFEQMMETASEWSREAEFFLRRDPRTYPWDIHYIKPQQDSGIEKQFSEQAKSADGASAWSTIQGYVEQSYNCVTERFPYNAVNYVLKRGVKNLVHCFFVSPHTVGLPEVRLVGACTQLERPKVVTTPTTTSSSNSFLIPKPELDALVAAVCPEDLQRYVGMWSEDDDVSVLLLLIFVMYQQREQLLSHASYALFQYAQRN